MKRIPTFEQFINEGYKFKDFEIGDKVKVSEKTGFPKGKIGEIVDIDKNKKIIFVDFGEEIKDWANWETNNLDGRINSNTGYAFFHRSILDKIFTSGWADPRNLIKIN